MDFQPHNQNAHKYDSRTFCIVVHVVSAAVTNNLHYHQSPHTTHLFFWSRALFEQPSVGASEDLAFSVYVQYSVQQLFPGQIHCSFPVSVARKLTSYYINFLSFYFLTTFYSIEVHLSSQYDAFRTLLITCFSSCC